MTRVVTKKKRGSRWEMALHLAEWLNNEIHLSHSIQQFERDLGNGYLIGELLYKLGYYPAFNDEVKHSALPYEKVSIEDLCIIYKSISVLEWVYVSVGYSLDVN